MDINNVIIRRKKDICSVVCPLSFVKVKEKTFFGKGLSKKVEHTRASLTNYGWVVKWFSINFIKLENPVLLKSKI